MEERHIITEHFTNDMKRPCIDDISQGEALGRKLKMKGEEEMFKMLHPDHDRNNPRFRGICGTLGNPIFSDTPIEPPSYVRPIITGGLYGYERPVQHPLYNTSNAGYGRQPIPQTFPVSYHPKDLSFSKKQGVGGNYVDSHLTTELDSDFVSG